jgi:predicted DCC family thiol-disulfide oxidoreductase YuxK
MSRIKVYYNRACPVCEAGIKGQRERMGACPIPVEWIDVHRDAEAAREIGAELEFVRERLHVVDESGKVRVGAEAFSALWRHTPGQRLLARMIGLPVVRVLARWAYNAFAAGLYAWNRARGRWRAESSRGGEEECDRG